MRPAVLVDWVAVRDPAALCGGATECLQRIEWRGEPLCRMVTSSGRIGVGELGRLWRQCVDG